MTQQEAADIVKTAGDVYAQIINYDTGVVHKNTACFFIGNSAAYLFHAMLPQTKRDLNMHLIAASGLDDVGATSYYDDEYTLKYPHYREESDDEPEFTPGFGEYFNAKTKIPTMRWCNRTFKNNRMRDAVVYLVDFVASGRSMVNLV